MSNSKQAKKAGKPTIQQFGYLVKLNLPHFRVRYTYRFDHLGRGRESVCIVRNGVQERFGIRLGTWHALRTRGWVRPVGNVDSGDGLWTLSESGRAAMEAMEAESSSFAEFAAFLREEYAGH